MKSLHAKYIFEREKIETIENEKYFFTFKVIENELHVLDMFVDHDFRGSLVVHEMMEKIRVLADEKKVQYIVSNTIAGMPNSEKSLALQFRWGMKLLKCEGNTIYLVKEVKNG